MKRTAAGFLSTVFLLSLLPPLPAFASQVTADSLVGYWKFDEASGSTAADSSGEGNTGTYVNSPTISSNVPGSITFPDTHSLNFNGSNYVNAGTGTSLNLTTNFTLSFWSKLASPNPTNAFIFNQRKGTDSADGGTIYGIIYGFTAGKYEFYSQNYTGSDPRTALTTSVTDTNWHHIVWTYDGTTLKGYLDGVLDTSVAITFALTPSSARFYIGASTSTGGFFTGNVDDLRVYHRTLAPWEISELAAGNHPHAYWQGTNSTGVENAGNWSGSYVPDPYSRIVVQARANQLTLTGSLQVAGLTINTGATLRTNGLNLTMLDSGLFTNYGTLTIKGVETLSGLTNDSSKGTVLVYGTGSYTGLPTGSAYYNLTLNDGLIGYWKLDETSGTRAVDSSGYGNSGSILNGATMSTATPSVHFNDPRSLSFDGTDDYVMLPDSAALQPNAVTVSAWFKTTYAGHQIILRKRWNGFSLRINGGQVIASLWESSGSSYDLTSPLTYNDGAWHHALFTYDGTIILLYVDGVRVGTQVGAGTHQIYYSPGGISIGRDGDSDSGYFVGNIDDVRMYNRALKIGEVMALAAGNEPSTTLGTVTLNALTTINGTLTLNGGTLDVSTSSYGLIIGKNWLNNGGKFLPRSSTVTFNGTTSGLEILSGGQSFAKMTFSGTNGVWNTRDRMTASGTTVITAGTLDASGSYAMRFGQLSQVGGAIVPRSGTITLTNHSYTDTVTSALNILHFEDPRENGLVGYWKLDEGTNSGAIVDSSGYNPVGIRRGTGAIWTSSSLPSLGFDNAFAMHFNGAPGDAVSIAVSSSFPSNPSTITQAMWVKTTSTGTMVLVTRRNQLLSINSDWATLEMVNGAVLLVLDDRSYGHATTATTINDGQWHHVAGVKNGTTYSLYVDGIFRNSFTDAHSMDGSSGLNYNIGDSPNWPGTNFIGSIDDVRVYNRVLSATEIMNLARGNYANGSSAGTFTPGTALTVASLGLDSGNLNMTSNLTDTTPLILQSGNGNLTLGTGLTTLGGLILSGATLTGGAGNMDVNWDLRILTGSLIAPSGTIDLVGNWLKTGGTFNSNSGTVIMDGTSLTINGSTSFHNLTKTTTSADTLYFASGSTISVDGTLTLQGAASNLLKLRSTVAGNQWLINPLGARTLAYLDVQDSDNINTIAIDCLSPGLNCINSGNNTNWLLPPVPASSTSSQTTDTPSAGVSGGTRGHGTDLQRALTIRTTMLTNFNLQIALNKPGTITVGHSSSAASGVATPGGTTHTSSLSHASAATQVALGSRIAAERGHLLVAMDTKNVLYKDVPVDQWFAPYVSQVIVDGIAEGYKDNAGALTGEFGVANNVTRAEMLKMALEAAGKKPGVGVSVPRNLSAKNSWAAPYVAMAEKLQLSVFAVTMDVNVPATRGEVVQTILEAMGITIGSTAADYTDVPKNDRYSNAIAAGTFFGIVQGDTNAQGYPTGTFRPNDPINRAEVAKIIALAGKLLK